MPSPVHPYSDYGVALRTLKSARGWLGVLLVVCVIAQFIGFALMWWTPQPYVGLKAQWKQPPEAKRMPATSAASTTSKPAQVVGHAIDEDDRVMNIHDQWHRSYSILVPLTQIAALMAVCSQSIIVFLTLLVMLVAQAPGVAQMTRSLILSVLLLFMFLPWQHFFARDFQIPGVIYGYYELQSWIAPVVLGEQVQAYMTWVVYARFIVWPVIGLLVLLITAERFRAGVMIAIGHPLQSILQPRGMVGTVPPGAPAPRPLGPVVPLKR